MNDKEFVLVSQGMEIMRTKSQENAINYVKKENDEWFDYKQRCIDNYEDYADNYIDLEIEYPEDKRYLQLQSNWNSLREINNEAREYLTSYEAISTIQGLDDIEKNKQLDEKTINEMTNRYLKVHHKLLSILDKMNELEGKNNNE